MTEKKELLYEDRIKIFNDVFYEIIETPSIRWQLMEILTIYDKCDHEEVLLALAEIKKGILKKRSDDK